ncbi:hypothetical protein HELRODRAFT_77704 [Helobdella robusta]|uniref:RING-type domain-containing protein n=1 Tax=Helobdella robusta TaxID=6412 RepID=T1G326_HELRO|nr:hypothetical protein HELRODRAFT_77704 [Helobdella robusta]ESO05297.1 hypothetical protein HELRODRAFT_77704 [Helobdella robusta]
MLSYLKHVSSQISEKRIKLDDLKDVSDIELLSVRQIKDILTNNFVNYKGCCEKSELSNMVANLFLEHAKNKSSTFFFVIEIYIEEIKLDEISSDDLCKVCMENVIDCVLLECGHMAVCKYCGKQMAECPICRKYVSRVVHIFRA